MGGAELIRTFLEPKSVAIVGVTRRTGDGSNVLENLLWYGYKGGIYPVNPRAREVLGLRCYGSVEELPGATDLALVQTASQIVPAVVRDCVRKGIRAIIIQSDGFAELGSKGKALQDEVLAVARAGGARILGPNTFGVINAFDHLATAFAQFELVQSPIAAISQSGMFSTGHLYELPLGKVVDLGNASDIGFCDALEYFGRDAETKIILLHVEQIRDARRFLVVTAGVAKKKPVIAVHGGKSREGSVLTRSHSGSIAGNRAVFEAAFRQCGILQCNDLDEMRDTARAALGLPPMNGNKIAIMTFSMGAAVMLMDACQQYGLGLARLSHDTAQRIHELLPHPEGLANPVDLMPLFQSEVALANTSFRRILITLLRDKSVRAAVFISASLTPSMSDLGSILSECANDFPDKPVVSWVWGPGQERLGEAFKFNFVSSKSVATALNVSRQRVSL